MLRNKIFIQNLKCGGCASTIESALNSIEDIEVFKIDYEDNSIEFYQKVDGLQLLVLEKLKK